MIVRRTVSGKTDFTGTLVLALWPNALGTNASQYIVTVRTKESTTRYLAYVPNSDCQLMSIVDLEPAPALSVAQVAIRDANAARTAAEEYASEAAASAQTSSASEGNAQASATAASQSASAAALSESGAQTAEAGAEAALADAQEAAQGAQAALETMENIGSLPESNHVAIEALSETVQYTQKTVVTNQADIQSIRSDIETLVFKEVLPVSRINDNQLSVTGPEAAAGPYKLRRAIKLTQTSGGTGYVAGALYDADAGYVVVTVTGVAVEADLSEVWLGQDPDNAPLNTAEDEAVLAALVLG